MPGGAVLYVASHERGGSSTQYTLRISSLSNMHPHACIHMCIASCVWHVHGMCMQVIAFIVPSACYASLAPHWGVARGVALLTLVFGLVLLPLAVAVEFMPEEGR